MSDRQNPEKDSNRRPADVVPPAAAMPRRSPDFERPPLVETVLGVQFDPLAALRLAHLAAFLQARGVDTASIREAPARGQAVEPMTREEMWAGKTLRLDVFDVPPLRLLAHLVRQDGARLVQIENGWLGVNWQAQPGRATYPRFQTVRPEFDDWLSAFVNFLGRSDLEAPRANHWEVVYINVIPRGELWNSVGDWSAIFPALVGEATTVRCGPLQTAGGRWVFDLAPQKARLQVIVEHGRRTDPKPEEILSLKLTARGRVEEDDWASVAAGLDLGHDAIVHTFVDLASERALKYWGYRG